MSFIDLVAPIMKKEDKNVKKAVRLGAIKIGEEIRKEFQLAILEFYHAYSPKQGRTWSMGGFERGVGGKRKYYKWKSEYVYETGLAVDPSFYDGNPYAKKHGWKNVDPALIYQLSYLKGIHGFNADMVAAHNATSGITWNPGTIPEDSEAPDLIMNRNFESKFTFDYCDGIVQGIYGSL